MTERVLMSAPEIYGLCPRCLIFTWHRPFGAGLAQCTKCGATHSFGEVRRVEPPRVKRREKPAETKRQRGLFE
jgi:hypothetical protein